MKILPDTSAWISYFRSFDTPASIKLRRLIELEEDICLCGPVVTEILQGLKEEAQFKKIERNLLAFDYLPTSPAAFRHAAEIYRKLRSKGLTVRSSMDCIIAATALAHDVHLIHQDRDYDGIAKHFPLRVL
jgi:predicted nucleic acid-binding protein